MDKYFFPYGNKSKDFLLKRTIYLCHFLIKKHVDIIILACNTLSILVLNEVKKLFKTKIIGVFELLDIDSINKGLFIGTYNTINEIKNKGIVIDTLDGSFLIEAIEKKRSIDFFFKEKKDILEKYPFVILGCTHFIKIKNRFPKYISQDELFKKLRNVLLL